MRIDCFPPLKLSVNFIYRCSAMKGTVVSGFILLFLGTGLLSITFVLALLNLYSSATVMVFGGGFTEVLGASFGHLLSACIKVMFLGVMGWIGSITTARGITLLKSEETAKSPEKLTKSTGQAKGEVSERKSE